jgi:DNA sulfur modification protein DndD
LTLEYDTLVLENFGPYYRRNELKFAPAEGGHPVTLIDGKNGYGKTTILDAFHWLLYGDDDRQRRARRLNRAASRQGDSSMQVELRFQRGGERHQLIRSLTAPKGVTYEHYKEELAYLIDGQRQANPTARIREVLPDSASQFFFFDGARITRYADLENDMAVFDAIERVLGLPAYENAKIHLHRLRERWEKLARQDQAKDEATKEKIRELDRLGAVRSQLLDIIAEHEKQLVSLDERKETARAQLIKYEGLRERINRIKVLEADLIGHRQALHAAKVEQGKELRNFAHMVILPLLKDALASNQRAVDALSERQLSIERRTHVEEFLRFAEKESGPDVQRVVPDLRAALDRVFPKVIGSVDTTELPRLQVTVGELQARIRHIESLPPPAETREKHRALRALVAQEESERRELKRNLGELNGEDVRRVEHELEAINQRVGTLHTKIDTARRELQVTEGDYEKLNQEISRLRQGGQAEEYYRLAEHAKRLETAFEIVLTRVRTQKKINIEREATAFFRKVTRKSDVYDKFRINDDYTLALLDKRGIEHRRDQISAGEKQLVALSFIIGLMKSTEKGAPLVIDTPFGHLDLLHRENVIQHLPGIGQQLVFLITDADIAKEHEKQLNRFVGQRYIIAYDQEQQSSSLVEAKA